MELGARSVAGPGVSSPEPEITSTNPIYPHKQTKIKALSATRPGHSWLHGRGRNIRYERLRTSRESDLNARMAAALVHSGK
jgi:hypothetical protein